MMDAEIPPMQSFEEFERETERELAGPAGEPIGEGVERCDFQAFMPGHAYIFVPTGELWAGSSVNSRIPPIEDGVDKEGKPKFLSASAWLDRNRPVEQMTWVPGQPKVIRDRLISDGGWMMRNGVACFNLYREPTIGAAMHRRPAHGLIMFGAFIPTTPII
jgi:hypothetical protein